MIPYEVDKQHMLQPKRKLVKMNRFTHAREDVALLGTHDYEVALLDLEKLTGRKRAEVRYDLEHGISVITNTKVFAVEYVT